MKKKIISFIFYLGIILQIITLLWSGVMAETSIIQYDTYINSSTSYTAVSGESIKISGKGVVANILLKDITIDKSSEVSVSAIRVENGATVRLTIKGTNNLYSASGCAGISVDETSTLIIEESSNGTLNVYGGLMAAGIGGNAQKNNGTIIINGGTVFAYGGENAGQFADDRGGAGIGGGNNGSGGNITINGGVVTTRGGDTSAGIGGGNDGSAGTIIINGGTINANSGYQGAAIGGQNGSIEINGGDITAHGWAYGAAIGCDGHGSNVSITITGGKIKADSSSFCSAIGGSYSGTSGDIVISGGDIVADGEACGIGKAKSITISGGKINATAEAGGTGIMSSDITITDGVIVANGGSDGAGIGGSKGIINISGGTITAKGGYNGSGIGGKSGSSGGTIIITGGSIKAIPGSEEAQAVGSGANGSESTVTNGVEDVHLVIIKGLVTGSEIRYTCHSNELEYKYIGYGHLYDENLYLYLPNSNDGCPHVNRLINGAINATCCEIGYTGDTWCAECNTKIEIGEDISALGHKEVVLSGKPATCTENGLTEGKKCTVCGIITVKQEEIPALGHDWEYIIGKEPTCTEKGTTEGKECKRCGFVGAEAKKITPLGHDFVIDVEAKDPTCTESGTTEGKHCTRCGYRVEAEEIEPLGHTDNDHDGKCDVCGDTTYIHTAYCKCACHKKGLAKLFFKIGLFFQKIFKKNRICKCGVWHY